MGERARSARTSVARGVAQTESECGSELLRRTARRPRRSFGCTRLRAARPARRSAPLRAARSLAAGEFSTALLRARAARSAWSAGCPETDQATDRTRTRKTRENEKSPGIVLLF